MKKKWIVTVAMLLLAGCISGCGKKSATEDIAVITESSQEGDMTHQILETAGQYADDNGLALAEHESASSDAQDYMVAIQEAAEAGASVVIGYGEDFEIPLYTMQKKYKKVKFIIIDGAPRKAEGKKEKARSNTKAFIFDEVQAGFLAGYAAVKDGYTNIGFMGGVKEKQVAMYGSGFVQGADYAASEMGLSASEINIRYGYLGTNELSPSVMAKANAWYQDGCQLIFANGGSICSAVIKAAEQYDGKVIASDTVQTSTQQVVVTSAVKNVNDLLYQTIGSVFEDSFEGKTIETMDLTNDGIGLTMDSSAFTQFTDADYQSIVTSITNYDVIVSDSYVSALLKEEGTIANVTVDFVSFE